MQKEELNKQGKKGIFAHTFCPINNQRHTFIYVSSYSLSKFLSSVYYVSDIEQDAMDKKVCFLASGSTQSS